MELCDGHLGSYTHHAVPALPCELQAPIGAKLFMTVTLFDWTDSQSSRRLNLAVNTSQSRCTRQAEGSSDVASSCPSSTRHSLCFRAGEPPPKSRISSAM